MPGDLEFLEPARLLLLAAPLLILGVYIGMQIRRRGYVLRFSDLSLFDGVAPDQPGWRRHVPAVIAICALATTVLAFARPAVAQTKVRKDAVVVLAIDASISMEADDVSPSRIAAARKSAEAFLDEVPEGVRIGVVTFAGSARVLVPPVADIEYAREAIRSFDLDQGTAIGDAVVAALGTIESATTSEDAQSSAAIVLLSDGENTAGIANEDAASRARGEGIPVHTVAFGTDSGTVNDGMGNLVQVPVNRDALAKLATDTDGDSFSAQTAGELTSIYEDLGRELTSEEREPKEVSDAFAGFALLLGLVAGAGSLRWFGRLP
jgi:Ca-activated chloride channel family protein